ncbi:MAG TPA: arsenate reductase (glutaredoxin) [Acetobacteraceae bacterium]|nr:arsenate reductase (glutaredoxin) [Acetobacteraceae bacterium]
MIANPTQVVIYHNPKCSTSRKVLGMLQAAGVTPHVVEYLKTPPGRAELMDLLRRMDMKPRALLRRRGTPYEALGLDDPAKTDAELIDAMLQEPILIERPIVVGPRGVRLCRPVERVFEVLPQ